MIFIYTQIIKSRTIFGADYINKKKVLITKKEKFFGLADVNKWEITAKNLQQIDKNELLKNKNFAYELMFPKVKKNIILAFLAFCSGNYSS